MAVDFRQTEGVRLPQGSPAGGSYLDLPRPRSGVYPRHERQ